MMRVYSIFQKRVRKNSGYVLNTIMGVWNTIEKNEESSL